MPRVWIYDTTLRDGSQGEGISFSLQDKLMITRQLDNLGIDYVEGGFPLSNPKDFEYFQRIDELGLKHSRIVAFGMTCRRGIEVSSDPGMIALIESRAPVLAIVGKSWELHVHEVLRVTEQENLDMIGDSVRFAKSANREVVYDAEHFFDGYKDNPEFARQTIMAAESAGADWIVLCDTNGGNLPEKISEIVLEVRNKLSIPLGIHCHNDCDVAVANTLAAVSAGATQVQGTINGVGERCGNADLISIVSNLTLKKSEYELTAAQHIAGVTALSRFVYETANMNFRSHQPFVGSSAFAHKGGMHVHAVNRNAKAYEHIPPELTGNGRRVLVSELSGRSNIVATTSQYELSEDPELMRAILERVQELENEGYQFEGASGSFDLLVKRIVGTYHSFFDRIHYRVNIETDKEGNTVDEATVKIRVNDQQEHTVAEGDGPVNALDSALRKSLQSYYPSLKDIQLVDYRVRVIDSRSATAARVRVVIESRDQDDTWGTVGVSKSIVEASWQALVDSFEYKLYKDGSANQAVSD